MAITVTGATIYAYNTSSKALTTETTPAVNASGSINFYRAGYDDTVTRYSTLLTCTTNQAISTLKITMRTAGWDNTNASKLLAVRVVRQKNDNYLKTTDGGDGIVRFAYEYNGGSYVGNASDNYHSVTTVSLISAERIIPANSTFYIYIVPYNNTYNYSTMYDAVKTTNTNYKIKFEPSIFGSYVKIFNGSSYVNAIPWVYNGSKWVRAIPWVYNGSWKRGIS